MFTHLPAQQVYDAIEAAAADVLAEARVAAPPVDAIDVAERLGMKVVRDGPAEVRARFVRLHGSSRGQDVILLADEPRPERRYWAVAHEIGESAAYRVFAALGVGPADAVESARERVANRLAGCLLLPRRWLEQDGAACDWDLLTLKQKYCTASHELIARRMLEMTPAVVVTLLDQGRVVWRRSNVQRPPALTSAEHDVWRSAHRENQPQRCARSALPPGVDDIRAWPVHEPGWKREVLRTEIAEVGGGW